MSRVLQRGELMEVDGVWHVVMSSPDPRRPGLYRWRDGQLYTCAEIIDPAEERKIRRAPPAPLDDDPFPLRTVGGYAVVRARPRPGPA